MATEALKSAQITNSIATPSVLNPAYQAGGRVRCHRAVVTSVLAIADSGSTYRFFRVKSGDMVKDLRIDNASLGAACTADIGLHKVNADGTIGAVQDADFFASALALTANTDLSVLRESTVLTLANMEKRVWEALGLATDPQVEYEVVITLVVASSIAAAMCLTGEVVGGH